MSDTTPSALSVASGEAVYQAYRAVIGRRVWDSEALLLTIENALRRAQGFRTELETSDALKHLDAFAAAYVLEFLSSAAFQRRPDVGRAIRAVARDLKKITF